MEELLECPVCWESFNLVENVPYVLWCGHTLCKTCILSLQRASKKFQAVPVQFPFFVSCPWCESLSLRLVWKENIKFPKKNYFLFWLVECANGNRTECYSTYNDPSTTSDTKSEPHSLSVENLREHSHVESSLQRLTDVGQLLNNFVARRINSSLRKSMTLFLQLTAKFPVVVMFLLIVLHVIPGTIMILMVYLLITLLFALPAALVLYFSYPTLDWLMKEIIS